MNPALAQELHTQIPPMLEDLASYKEASKGRIWGRTPNRT